MHTRNVSGDSEVMLSFFGCSKLLVQVCNTSDVHTGQTFAINWSKVQLSWVLMLYYLDKTMFSAYKSVIVSPCACDLFISKVTKIAWYMDVRFWRSFFGAFSVCDDCILKSTTAWLLKLSVLYIHSFMHVQNTTFQIKTVFNNVLFSTKVHPLHALSHIYDTAFYILIFLKNYVCLYKFIFAEALIYQKYFINTLFFFLLFSVSFMTSCNTDTVWLLIIIIFILYCFCW